MDGTQYRIRWAAIGLVLGGCLAGACGSAAGVATTPPATSSTTVASTTTTIVAPTTTTTTLTIPVPSSSTTTTSLQPVGLQPGDRGMAVARLQEALVAAGFFRDAVDGVYGERTAAAVVAVHKAIDRDRTSTWNPGDWEAIAGFTGPAVPDRPDEPDRVEIDLTRQLLYRVEGGAVVDIVPISSGNGEAYENAAGRIVRARTPQGDFALYKRYDGWRVSYLGGLYRPWYFTGGYAIHGSSSVPAHPASHGCIRVPIWEADHLWERLGIGLPVHVWSSTAI